MRGGAKEGSMSGLVAGAWGLDAQGEQIQRDVGRESQDRAKKQDCMLLAGRGTSGDWRPERGMGICDIVGGISLQRREGA